MNLPTILSGPIVRRVDETSVCIWIATSKPFRLGAELYSIRKSHNICNYYSIDIQCTSETIRCGNRLYIYLLEIIPTIGTFPTNCLLGYNLTFQNEASTLDLYSFGLLEQSNPFSIVYGNLKYPTFIISKGQKSNILYGSCRKQHGEGDDALVSGDIVLEEEFDNLNKRPHSLFLLGDQIYADDISDPMFPIISEVANALIPLDENLSVLDIRLEAGSLQKSMNQIHGRQFIMNELCRFTSGEAYNHLIKFSEFSALYLLSFSPELWKWLQDHRLFYSFDEHVRTNNIHFVFPNEEPFVSKHKQEKAQARDRYERQWRAIQESLYTLPRIRRLLANVSTYMIFDDHDITDDWNISYNWKQSVWESPLGRHVVANGLTAYWLFQGWGNSPKTFQSSFKYKLKRYLKTFSIKSTAYSDWLNCLWDFKQWHFVAPTEPKTLFLDTRTRRGYDFEAKPIKLGKLFEEKSYPPQLICPAEWEALTQSLIDSNWEQQTPLVIASPTPLYGIGLLESFLNSYVFPLRALGLQVHQTFDMEAWKLNGKGFSHFLYSLFNLNPSYCFILSGDVHNAHAVKASVQLENGEKLKVVQFTSSPLKNMSFTGIWGYLLKLSISINSLKRKNKAIYRFSPDNHSIFYSRGNHEAPHSWKETINYIPLLNGSIIHTTNNLGLLTINEDTVQNHLLTYDRLIANTLSFKDVRLSKGTPIK
ncbi:hypothetical protein ACFSCX_11885 [Bacillus salitolerans]|uniref:PhoD-like phosphatase metallophosphatase domain-containing protein n=1 Tax=Bacillus salitolerans TaxID=1437434 RepID=A0ABW4LQB6_9BACI